MKYFKTYLIVLLCLFSVTRTTEGGCTEDGHCSLTRGFGFRKTHPTPLFETEYDSEHELEDFKTLLGEYTAALQQPRDSKGDAARSAVLEHAYKLNFLDLKKKEEEERKLENAKWWQCSSDASKRAFELWHPLMRLMDCTDPEAISDHIWELHSKMYKIILCANLQMKGIENCETPRAPTHYGRGLPLPSDDYERACLIPKKDAACNPAINLANELSHYVFYTDSDTDPRHAFLRNKLFLILQDKENVKSDLDKCERGRKEEEKEKAIALVENQKQCILSLLSHVFVFLVGMLISIIMMSCIAYKIVDGVYVNGIPYSHAVPSSSNATPIVSTNMVDITCVLCKDEDISISFGPCGHATCCNECADQLSICPTCRVKIQARNIVFIG